jgi:hypothetical protein
MKRWERIKLSLAISVLVFFIQVVLLVINIQFVDEGTGQFRLGAQFRFKFVDETTRQFVLLSQLQKLPDELLLVFEISVAVAALCYGAISLYYQYRPLAPWAEEEERLQIQDTKTQNSESGFRDESNGT